MDGSGRYWSVVDGNGRWWTVISMTAKRRDHAILFVYIVLISFLDKSSKAVHSGLSNDYIESTASDGLS